MIYLAHTNGSIAACESAETTRKREALGYVQVSGALHRVLWQRKDRQALARLPAAIEQARAVGEPWRAPWLLKDVPKK